jgi:hypothetical protein
LAVSTEFTANQSGGSILHTIEAIKTALILAAEEALRDAINKIAIAALVGHAATVNGVALIREGHALAMASQDDMIRMWR